MFEDLNPYLLMAVAGLFTGLGSVIGQWFFKALIEPRFNKIHKKIKRVIK